MVAKCCVFPFPGRSPGFRDFPRKVPRDECLAKDRSLGPNLQSIDVSSPSTGADEKERRNSVGAVEKISRALGR